MRHWIKSSVVFLVGLYVSVNNAIADDHNNVDHSGLSDASIISDPHEGWNRGVFAFNNALDQYILEPVSIGYNTVTPDVLRLIIRNELDYVQSPVSIVNSILQGDIDVILHTIGRFFINTTFGGIGVLDAASDFGLKPHKEDFGQTLAVWGVPDGGYHVTPFLGSMTLRDFGGRIVDIGLNPTNHAGDNMTIFPAVTAIGVVDFRASNSDFIDNLKNSSSDYYATVRTIYIQRRNSDIKNTSFNADNKNQNEQQPEFINFDE